MNYAGKFDATFASEGPATHPHHAYVNVDSSQVHAPADAIIVPDAQLLFHADYKRSGTDLILSRDHHEFVLHDYFRGGHRSALASPDGAHLTADIVKALVGEVDVAQAANNPAASQVIGHCTKLQGSATVIRNGVSIILNMGDNVEKGDVVQSGSSSTVGITFIDGTVFGLSSNARMVLNEMVYDPNGSSNSSLMSFVAGTITFVAGETAKHGDMKIDTPVATMGIRGTAVLVEIDFSVPGQNGQPNASFQVLVEPDGTTGSYILFDKTTLQPIAIVNQAGQQLNINNGIISQTTTPLSPDIQKLITDVFQQKFTDNSNTKSTSPSNDSINPQQGPIIKLANGTTATPVFTVTGTSGGSSTPPPNQQSNPLLHVSGTLALQVLNPSAQPQINFATTELANKTGDVNDFESVGGTFQFQDINQGDRPSLTADFTKVIYTNANGSFTIGAGQTLPPGLSALQFADISATAVKLAMVGDPGNANNGKATWVYAVRDSAFDFLAAGETLTFTYHVTVASNFAQGPEFQSQDITITVTGTNDKPVITTGPQGISFVAGAATPGGDLPTSDPTSGTFAFTNVDLSDKHTASKALISAVMSNGGTVPMQSETFFESALSASIATDSTGTGKGVVHWQFADLPADVADFIPKGESVTLTYAVTVTDSNGATSTQTVTVTIGGAPGEIWIHTTDDNSPDGNWTTGQNWKTGRAPVSSDDVIITTNQLHPHNPSYPVTISGEIAAVAKSVTMDDFGDPTDPVHQAPELDVASGASLTISEVLSLSVDSRLINDGIVTVGGKLELLDSFDQEGGLVAPNQSAIFNSGVLNLEKGGDIQGLANVTNTGLIDLQGGTLNVAVEITNSDGESDGQITVEEEATLVLGADANDIGNPNGHGGITGGTVTIKGELDFQGSNFLSNGTLINTGQVNVAGTGNSLDNEFVNNLGGTISITGMLTLDDGTTIADGDLFNSGTLQVESVDGATLDGVAVDNTGGTIAVDREESPDTVTLTLDDGTAITNGNLTVGSVGILEISSELGATLDGVSVDNFGLIRVDEGATLLLADGTTVYGGSLSISGTLEVDSLGGATLDGVSVDNADLVQVDDGSTLLLEDGTTIFGGSLTNAGTLQIETSDGATLDGVTVDNTNGTIAVDSDSSPDTVTLVLDDGTTVTGGNVTIGGVGILEVSDDSGVALDSVVVNNSGVIQIDEGAALTLDGSTVNGGTITDDGMLAIDENKTLKLNGVALSGGRINNSGTVEITGSGSIENDLFANAAAVLLIDAGKTLTLDGTTITGGDVTSHGTVNVDAGKTLALNSVTITGGDVTNAGIVNSTGGATIDNADISNTGTIESTIGVMKIDPVGQSDTLTNSGTVQANGGELDIAGEQIVNTGTVQAIANGTLKLISTTVTSSVTDPVTHAVTDGTVSVEKGATLDLSDSGITGGNVSIAGTLHADGTSFVDAAIANNGLIEVTSGWLKLSGSISGAGSAQIDANAKLELNLDDTQAINFNGAGAELKIDGLHLTGPIAGLTVTDKIDLGGIAYGTATTGTYDATTGVLSITDGNCDHIDLNIGPGYSGAHFAGSDDGSGHTLVTLNANDDFPAFTQDSVAASLFEQANVSHSSTPDTVGGSLVFTDIDLTDRPTASIIAQSVVDANGNDISSTLTPAELSALEGALKLTPHTGTANNGAVDWSYSIADSKLDFLRTDQTLTVTSTINLDDHQGGADTATISVTIHGSEDVPSIVGESNPATQTVILSVLPTVLAPGGTDNGLGLSQESFDSIAIGSASNNGLGHGDFTSEALGATFAASGPAGVVQGSGSASAAPFLGPLPGHVDESHYLSIGGGGSETITFAHDQNAFGLYWGSVDSYNTISFYDGSELVASYGGADVTPLLASGGQSSFSSNGYVEFKDLAPFDKVVLASSSSAFEVDNISAGYIKDSHIQLTNPVSGTLSVSDADVGDPLTAKVTANGVATYDGSTTLPPGLNLSSLVDAHAITFDSVTSNGGQEVLHWTYNPTNANFDFLEPGDTLTLTFNAEVTDGQVTTGNQALTVNIVGTGASVVHGTDGNDAFVNVGGGVTIFGQAGNDTFQFKSDFERATIGDFNIANDAINIDNTLFASVQAILDSAQSANSGHDTVITDAAHDQITLSGVTLAQVRAHPGDFHLV